MNMYDKFLNTTLSKDELRSDMGIYEPPLYLPKYEDYVKSIASLGTVFGKMLIDDIIKSKPSNTGDSNE